MNKVRFWFEKLLSLLHVRSTVIGLEISDEVIRLAYFGNGLWQRYAIRLSPGTMENGVIKDRNAFLKALSDLRVQSKIAGRSKAKKINVVVVLGSVNSYSKVFQLPMLEGGDLEKAIGLNLDMASPSDASQVYGSSQIVGRDESLSQLDILAAFMDRSLVEGLVDALSETGFVAMAVEPKALALTRILREKGSGLDITKPYIVVSIDNTGLRFLIVRNGVPYFEYMNHWRDIAGEKGELSLDALEGDLTASLRQVTNFYAQHWPEPLAAIILSNDLFPEELEKTIAKNFTVPVVRLTLLMGEVIPSEWLVALGSSLREANVTSSNEKEINFLGGPLEDGFRIEQVLRFLEFWRVVLPASLLVLVALFFASNVSLGSTQTVVASEPGAAIDPAQNQEVGQLEASTTAFSNLVSVISGLESSASTQSLLLGDIVGMANANGITISHLTNQGAGAPITLSATASSESDINAFRNALGNDSKISSVNLPLTNIQPIPGNEFSFLVTFNYQ